MTFKSIDEYAKKSRALWEAHISPEVKALVERPEKISLAEYQQLRLNSYEQQEVYQRLDDEALAFMIELCLKNVSQVRRVHSRIMPSTYDEAVVFLAGLTVNRLKELARLTALIYDLRQSFCAIALGIPNPSGEAHAVLKRLAIHHDGE